MKNNAKGKQVGCNLRNQRSALSLETQLLHKKVNRIFSPVKHFCYGTNVNLISSEATDGTENTISNTSSSPGE